VTIDAGGNVETARNVVTVIPTAPSLGYIPPGFDVTPVSTGDDYIGDGIFLVSYLEPDSLVDGQRYEVQFLDVSMDGRDNNGNGLKDGQDFVESLGLETSGFALNTFTQSGTVEAVDTVWFKEYRGGDSTWTEIKNLYWDMDRDSLTLEAHTHGLAFYLYNPTPQTVHDPDRGINNGIRWSANINIEDTYPIRYEEFNQIGLLDGYWDPAMYMVVFDDHLSNTSVEALVPKPDPVDSTNYIFESYPAIPCNFRVYNLVSCDDSGWNCDEVPFAFYDSNINMFPGAPRPTEDGFFSGGDKIIFSRHIVDTLVVVDDSGAEPDTLEYSILDTTLITMQIVNAGNTDTDYEFIDNYARSLSVGDTLYAYALPQYNRHHSYEFVTRGHKVDQKYARRNMDKIKVVPNPYVATNIFELQNPYSNGRGDRVIRFINLPSECTIHIFAADGTHVNTLEHMSSIDNGSAEWNLITKDNMDVAYGLYIYHVDAPGIGEHVGKFLIIK